MLFVMRIFEGGGIIDIYIIIILYMNRDCLKDCVVIIICDDVFYFFGLLKYWLNVINSWGYKFLYVDCFIVINFVNVVSVNEIYKEVFFDCEVIRKLIKCEIVYYRYYEFVSELIVIN